MGVRSACPPKNPLVWDHIGYVVVAVYLEEILKKIPMMSAVLCADVYACTRLQSVYMLIIFPLILDFSLFLMFVNGLSGYVTLLKYVMQ